MSLQPVEIAFALYPVSDIERARKFYEGALGLKVGLQKEFTPGKWWIEYELGNTSLGITNFDAPSGQKGPGIAIEVANFEAALAALKAAGIAITWGPHEAPTCHTFGVKDPDGNELYIHQRKAKA
jgi:catechol 2,3-dioxygenase-like lactoylglutathione lyase family enzyme